MGTRGFVGFAIDGELKLAYNHWDSYPSGLGLTTLEWARRVPGRRVGPALEHIRNLARELQPVDNSVPPTAEQIDQLQAWTDLTVSSQSTEDWYCLLRKTQGDVGAILTAGYFEDSGDFPYDSLFCEYGYLIDLDNHRFEVYKGFQEKPHGMGRFAEGRMEDKYGDKYYPVALTAAWKLDELPTNEEFLALLEEDDW